MLLAVDKLDISVIVLTYNEERNITDCLKSVYIWAADIFIVDSFSTDKTLEAAGVYTDKIVKHPFYNYSKQYNWALEHLPIKTTWIMRLDADEIVTTELRDELAEKLPIIPSRITGLYLKRRVYFMNKWIKHGGLYPVWHLRIWRSGKARCEDTWMDEHIKITEGEAAFLRNDIVDNNKKDLQWWTEKHNRYASREALDIINLRNKRLSQDTIPPRLLGSQEQRKRWLKINIYAHLPLFIRPYLYFLFRYFIKAGFLDGKEGLIFHFLQGFWYRFLVDAKLYEYEKRKRFY
jgi:glycosyltransferase involved in cell wall biosynthesis